MRRAPSPSVSRPGEAAGSTRIDGAGRHLCSQPLVFESREEERQRFRRLKVVAAMRDIGEYDDPLFGRTKVRTDGRATHPVYLMEVKKPSESKGPYDYYKILATVPPDQAARSLEESRAAGCELAK